MATVNRNAAEQKYRSSRAVLARKAPTKLREKNSEILRVEAESTATERQAKERPVANRVNR